MTPATDVPSILSAIERGEARAADELLPLVDAELRALASSALAQRMNRVLELRHGRLGAAGAMA